MKVKSIHFLPQSPGQPVYEMTDGTLRIPFFDKTGKVFWASESEMTRGVSDTKKLIAFRRPFFEAKKTIMESKAVTVN